MLKDKPNPYPWLIAAAITAILVGSLFRGYNQTQVGFLRMFGTIGLVVIGYFTTRAFYAFQEGEALERLKGALADLPPDFQVGSSLMVRDPQNSRRLIVDLTLVTPHGLLLMAIDVTRPFVNSSKALSNWSRRARQLWRSIRILNEKLKPLGEIPIGGIVLTLFRNNDGIPSVEGIPLVTTDALREALLSPELQLSDRSLAPEARAKLLKLLQPTDSETALTAQYQQ